MRISDWSSDVGSSDLGARGPSVRHRRRRLQGRPARLAGAAGAGRQGAALGARAQIPRRARADDARTDRQPGRADGQAPARNTADIGRAEWRAKGWQYESNWVVAVSCKKKSRAE